MGSDVYIPPYIEGGYIYEMCYVLLGLTHITKNDKTLIKLGLRRRGVLMKSLNVIPFVCSECLEFRLI